MRLVECLLLGERDSSRRIDLVQQRARVHVQILERTDEVVRHDAWLTNVVNRHPVLVHILRGLVYHVPRELRERDVMTLRALRRNAAGFLAIALHDFRAVHPVELEVHALKLVSVRGDEAAERISHEHELEQGLHEASPFGHAEVAEEFEATLIEVLNRVRVLALALQRQYEPFHVRGGDLRHEAVQEVVFLVDDDVSKEIRRFALGKGFQRGYIFFAAAFPIQGVLPGISIKLNYKLSH